MCLLCRRLRKGFGSISNKVKSDEKKTLRVKAPGRFLVYIEDLSYFPKKGIDLIFLCQQSGLNN
jgi:hypothetical protein